MILWFALSLEALLGGHHPLPAQIPVALCAQLSEAKPWRAGLRRHRLRALGMARRCALVVDNTRLVKDRDPEVRLAGWLGRAGQATDPSPHLTAALADPSASLRLAILQWAKRHKIRLNGHRLRGLQHGDASPAVRRAAAEALR